MKRLLLLGALCVVPLSASLTQVSSQREINSMVSINPYVVISFYAGDTGTSKFAKGIEDAVSVTTIGKQVQFLRIPQYDANDSIKAIATKYGVTSAPYFVFIKDRVVLANESCAYTAVASTKAFGDKLQRVFGISATATPVVTTPDTTTPADAGRPAARGTTTTPQRQGR